MRPLIGGRMGKSFHDLLVAARDSKHSKDHLFFELWSQGKLTKKQTTVYCAQHYHYVSEYLNWMAYEASQIPFRDVKAYLFENLGDEENPDDRHLERLCRGYRIGSRQCGGFGGAGRNGGPAELGLASCLSKPVAGRGGRHVCRPRVPVPGHLQKNRPGAT